MPLLESPLILPLTRENLNVIIRYWDHGAKVHIEVWMTIFIALILVVNLLGVRFFGELEFWLSSVKVLALIALSLFGIITDLAGNPKHDRVGFRYWKDPGVFSHYLREGGLGQFLGVWAVLTNALFAYMGTELVGMTVGEAENPRKNIPKAIKRTFFRILVFYVGGVFVIGLVVPSDDPKLFIASKAKTGAAASPFVVAATNFGIRGLNQIINAALLIFVTSAAISDLYIGSRMLYALAAEGIAPKLFKRVCKGGVPYPALIVCAAFCSLVYLNTTSSAAQVFGYFSNVTTVFGAITWMSICTSHIRFMGALKARGISRDTLPYKAPLQPWGSWFALICTALITFFKGFDTFIPWNVKTFITSYIGAPVFFILWSGYKIKYRTNMIPLQDVDLMSGKRHIDEEEERYIAEQEAKGPRTIWQKIWDGL